MPSVSNPNHTSKHTLSARAGGRKKLAQRLSAAGVHKISVDDMNRGARPGLLPNSGPRAALSKKKQKKVDQQLKLALRRKMEAEAAAAAAAGEVIMADAPAPKKAKDQVMEVDIQ
ncbi:hypothetical protein B0T19DRAFT_442436 [Cercophora scortea]|uniref:Uncharacterized protein n=1 Tax=Cercophora scortea TaxID=314031 RepID=A0AAE0INM8_9PEZI|nr:hypothetical protein B0T19DRAFT_442436 [Cercophora scortea]